MIKKRELSLSERREMIAKRLRAARELAGLSQAQAAELLDVHRPTISEMEAGRRRVASEELAQLAEIYGVSAAWLLGEGGTEGLDQSLQLAARELERLAPEDLEQVIRVLSMLRTGGSGVV